MPLNTYDDPDVITDSDGDEAQVSSDGRLQSQVNFTTEVLQEFLLMRMAMFQILDELKKLSSAIHEGLDLEKDC